MGRLTWQTWGTDPGGKRLKHKNMSRAEMYLILILTLLHSKQNTSKVSLSSASSSFLILVLHGFDSYWLPQKGFPPAQCIKRVRVLVDIHGGIAHAPPRTSPNSAPEDGG